MSYTTWEAGLRERIRPLFRSQEQLLNAGAPSEYRVVEQINEQIEAAILDYRKRVAEKTLRAANGGKAMGRDLKAEVSKLFADFDRSEDAVTTRWHDGEYDLGDVQMMSQSNREYLIERIVELIAERPAVSTVEELEALPFGTIVLVTPYNHADPYPCQKYQIWHMIAASMRVEPEFIINDGVVTVLRLGGRA